MLTDIFGRGVPVAFDLDPANAPPVRPESAALASVGSSRRPGSAALVSEETPRAAFLRTSASMRSLEPIEVLIFTEFRNAHYDWCVARFSETPYLIITVLHG